MKTKLDLYCSTPVALARRAMGVVTKFWRRRRVRTRILLVFISLSVAVSVLAAGGIFLNAKHRIETEYKAAVALTERYIKDMTRFLAQDEQTTRSLPEALAVQLRHLRHVKAWVLDAGGNVVAAPNEAATAQAREDEPPAWFVALANPGFEHREIRIRVGEKRLGAVFLAANATDELSEVWTDMVRLALIWIAANTAMILAFYAILGRILDPLLTVSRGMKDLEQGHYSVHLPSPNVPELDPIVCNFNKLASALAAAREENCRLCRELITVQEEERRQIASELHDEAGPCLFGITTTAAAIEARLARGKHEEGEEIGRQLTEIGTIAQRLKTLNRQIMKRLRPMALGRVPIRELIGDLIADFERRYPDVRFLTDFGGEARSYGDRVDLTVYRCIQEGVFNALKHGQPGCVSIELNETDVQAGELHVRALSLVVRDDGKGMTASSSIGFGLTVMRERVQSLGGEWELSDNWPSGATIAATLPLGAPSAALATGGA